ncbi:hypothetical protein TNCV_1225391 [Trichonephila clavipes]|nr:hypothetical protein TNCV_1225391 [Trichonephila clavipes]
MPAFLDKQAQLSIEDANEIRLVISIRWVIEALERWSVARRWSWLTPGVPRMIRISRTSAELPHKVHCLLEARENLMTHPAIYESNDPPGVGMFWHSLAEEFNPSVMGKENEFHQSIENAERIGNCKRLNDIGESEGIIGIRGRSTTSP